MLPLLKKATQPKFVIIGSSLGCTGSMEASAAYPFFAYGASKAVAHYMARKIYFENEGLVAFAVSPGYVGGGLLVSGGTDRLGCGLTVRV